MSAAEAAVTEVAFDAAAGRAEDTAHGRANALDAGKGRNECESGTEMSGNELAAGG